MTLMSFTRFLTAIIMIPYFLFNYTFNNYAYPAVSTEGAYVFCYFVGNEVDEQTIHLAVSTDGYNFKALNNNEPIIEQTKGTGCVRDPYMLKGVDENGADCYFIIATDMNALDGWTSNHALITWRSYDLINWTDETVIDIRQFDGFETTNKYGAWHRITDVEAAIHTRVCARVGEVKGNEHRHGSSETFFGVMLAQCRHLFQIGDSGRRNKCHEIIHCAMLFREGASHVGIGLGMYLSRGFFPRIVFYFFAEHSVKFFECHDSISWHRSEARTSYNTLRRCAFLLENIPMPGRGRERDGTGRANGTQSEPYSMRCPESVRQDGLWPSRRHGQLSYM